MNCKAATAALVFPPASLTVPCNLKIHFRSKTGVWYGICTYEVFYTGDRISYPPALLASWNTHLWCTELPVLPIPTICLRRKIWCKANPDVKTWYSVLWWSSAVQYYWRMSLDGCSFACKCRDWACMYLATVCAWYCRLPQALAW